MNLRPHVETAAESGRGLRLALVLWDGDIGGAEILNATLAESLRRLGADVTILFIGTPWPLAERLACAGIPYYSLGFGRGRSVLRHPRRYAAEIARVGPDGALLVERGFMGTALRAGGYRSPIVAVEHGGFLLKQQHLARPQQLLRQISRASGARTADAEVAVSDFVLERMRQHAHARRILRIYNGIDPDKHVPIAEMPTDRGPHFVVVGFVGRLVTGKGADCLIQAVAQTTGQIPVKLLIAGDGPERSRLVSLAHESGANSRVEFLGIVDDLPSFWQQCDIAALPSDALESFSMATLEAMACGKPVVATHTGAIPELVVDGVTGALIPPGDVHALARALVVYVEQPELRRAHGTAARARAIERFHINSCARAYVNLFNELAICRSA
jgi:glycosyltransferase involved in cell wall biosynthesis